MKSLGEIFIGLCNKRIFRIIFVMVVCVSVFGIFGFAIINGQPKYALTCEQFDKIAANLGYETTDSTEQYQEQFDSTLIGSRGIHSNVLRFEFFEFSNSDMAHKLWSSCYQEIIKNRSPHDVEYENYYSNYREYALESLGKYYTVIYVGNTAVLAECANEESINDILNILEEMEYNPKASKNNKGKE